jgi:hypothetical protein
MPDFSDNAALDSLPTTEVAEVPLCARCPRDNAGQAAVLVAVPSEGDVPMCLADAGSYLRHGAAVRRLVILDRSGN